MFLVPDFPNISEDSKKLTVLTFAFSVTSHRIVYVHYTGPFLARMSAGTNALSRAASINPLVDAMVIPLVLERTL